jgi:hypothetical protein
MHAAHARQQAERLQSEVLKLAPGVTTFNEVRSFVSRTERPEGYAGFDGPCDESTCTVSIGPMAFIEHWHGPLSQPLGRLGIRPVNYAAIVEVRDGIVRKVDFSVFYRAGDRQIFSASVVLVEQFSSDDLRGTSVSKVDSAYAVCGGAMRGTNGDQVGKALLVGTATAKTNERITLNLSCVTSMHGCSDPADLLRTQKTSVPDLVSRSAPPECAPPQELAWSSMWSASKYPH